MASTAERRIAPIYSRRTSSSRRPSDNGAHMPINPADMIAGLSFREESLDSNSSALLTPPREGRQSNPPFMFGKASSPSNDPPSFTFAQLYNITPLPSPRPSPEPSSSSTEQLTPRFSLSPQRGLSLGTHNNNASDRTYFGSPTGSFAQGSRRPSDASAVSATANTAPYDVNSETVPDEPFFHPRFQATLVKGIDLAQKVEHVLAADQSEVRRDPDLDRLCNDAHRLGKFQTSDTRTVAVLGDSGEGDIQL